MHILVPHSPFLSFVNIYFMIIFLQASDWLLIVRSEVTIRVPCLQRVGLMIYQPGSYSFWIARIPTLSFCRSTYAFENKIVC